MSFFNRSITNKIRFFLDECLPPILRDNKYFMYPFFYIWYKGKQVEKLMSFKTYFHLLTESEYKDLYLVQESFAYDRPTDLSEDTINCIVSNLDKDDKIIDIGCGRGYFLEHLNSIDFQDLTGYDFVEPKNIKGFVFKEGNLENLPFSDKSFDIVICSHTIEHLLEPKKAIAEMIRIAKKKVIITVPKQRWYKYSFDLHIHFFPEKSYLIQLVGLPKYICIEIKGDWTYIGHLE